MRWFRRKPEPGHVSPGSPPGGPMSPGARVWAPWEGQFLYSATIVSVVGPNVTVRFDTGEEKGDLLDNLRPLRPDKQIVSGQQIFMMYDAEARSYMFYPATVRSVTGEYFEVMREDNRPEGRVHVKRVRIPESALPLNLEPEWVMQSFVRLKEPEFFDVNIMADTSLANPIWASRREIDTLYQANDRVLARWHDYYWYPATVMSISKEGIQVHFADGDRGFVMEKHLLPLYCEEGERIFIRPPEEARLMYSPAIITRIDGEMLDVEFEANDQQESRHVSGLSINRARFWRLPKGTRPLNLDAGTSVLVLLGAYWYPGRILPAREENMFGPREDVVFIELLYGAHDVMVTPELIKPMRFSAGTEVECARGGGAYIAAKIAEVKGEKLLVKYL
ncbi:MAG TPA: hypothetical protein VFE62_04255 [Gemmataceae bacterium]|nr:hypothetical protein [Gemmataceae bacterium]